MRKILSNQLLSWITILIIPGVSFLLTYDKPIQNSWDSSELRVILGIGFIFIGIFSFITLVWRFKQTGDNSEE